MTDDNEAREIDVTQDQADSDYDALAAADVEEEQGPIVPWQVTFAEWVQEHFAGVEFFTADAKIKWCPTWWEHPEAIARLKALWASHVVLEYEEDAAATSNWWLHHWDAHRAILFHDKGPFRNCDVEHGHLWTASDKRVLPVPAAPPESWQG